MERFNLKIEEIFKKHGIEWIDGKYNEFNGCYARFCQYKGGAREPVSKHGLSGILMEAMLTESKKVYYNKFGMEGVVGEITLRSGYIREFLTVEGVVENVEGKGFCECIFEAAREVFE